MFRSADQERGVVVEGGDFVVEFKWESVDLWGCG